MIILVVLGLILGLWGTGDAGWGEVCPLGQMCSELPIVKRSVGTALVTCNESQTKCWTPCEQKMREAMRVMNEAIDKALEHRPGSFYDMLIAFLATICLIMKLGAVFA